ncbi:MAG: hypothetical protein JNJ57_14975 [Saprospiraceae bacterium]|nr:hypothetical protein [Saprospiraceae bacterium]
MQTNIIFDTRASGKLLLTGEYFVLDGAYALALPVRFGQSLRVEAVQQEGYFYWNSCDQDGSSWFNVEYELPYLSVVQTSDRSIAEMLASIIRECQRQNPAFLKVMGGLKAHTISDFPRAWGLGTSSTLIAAIARWAQVDPYPVLRNTLGGSGYDIACAYAESPLLYRIVNDKPEVRCVTFDPPFTHQLYFVYLEKKQNSREGIALYREKSKEIKRLIPDISTLTERILNADTLHSFEKLLFEHESLIADALDFQRVKNRLFNDYWGEIKSLGAWGGDFVLATSSEPESSTRQYFSDRGFNTVLTWKEMVPPL